MAENIAQGPRRRRSRLKVGAATLAIKMPRDYDVDFDTVVGVRFPSDQGFLFDAESGGRLDARAEAAAAG